MKKICIFGGSFDPPHIGHEMIIKELIKLDFDLILVMPTKEVEYKTINSNVEDRINMIKIIVKKYNEKVIFSDMEINRVGITKTFDTIKSIKDIYKDYEICFALGSDSINTLPTWDEYEYLKENVNFIIADREDCIIPNDLKYVKIQNNIVDISSTELRKNLKKEYLDIDVYNYIIENKLY